MTNGIWISWETQRRNRGLAGALGWPLYEIDIAASPLRRYAVSILKTISIIAKEKPKAIVVQNPSIVLAILAAIAKLFFGYVFIMDAHNGGIKPREGTSKILMLIANRLQKAADITIVTNPALKAQVDSHGGHGICLPDVLPAAPAVPPKRLEGAFSIAFICTFSNDEPYKEVILAARLVPRDFIIYITGKHNEKVIADEIPPNVRLLGFVPERSFWELLGSADAIMDLTTREDCLVCGAYEGVALGKPLILSNTRALRSYFNKGAMYVDPIAESIARGITSAAENHAGLLKDIQELKATITKDWQAHFLGFQQAIQKAIAGHPKKQPQEKR
jgi:glycosyltransferase involved in cell wall biosynthesis